MKTYRFAVWPYFLIPTEKVLPPPEGDALDSRFGTLMLTAEQIALLPRIEAKNVDDAMRKAWGPCGSKLPPEHLLVLFADGGNIPLQVAEYIHEPYSSVDILAEFRVPREFHG